MIPLLMRAATATPANSVPAAVGGLAGCWKVAGQVRGKDATSVARGEWHLGGRYFMLHLRSLNPKQPYEAAIAYGAGEKPGAVGSFWMDTFGGMYEPSFGLGSVTAKGFTLNYRFPDAIYANDFQHAAKGWTWTIAEKASGKPDKLFARYDLQRSRCAGMKFNF